MPHESQPAALPRGGGFACWCERDAPPRLARHATSRHTSRHCASWSTSSVQAASLHPCMLRVACLVPGTPPPGSGPCGGARCSVLLSWGPGARHFLHFNCPGCNRRATRDAAYSCGRRPALADHDRATKATRAHTGAETADADDELGHRRRITDRCGRGR